MSDAAQKYVLFRVGAEEYGLPISRVSSIIRYEHITPVPRAPRAVQGVLDLRGHVVPVVDLGKRLFGADVDVTPKTRIVVAEGEDGEVGLIVDAASEVASFEESELMPAPAAAVAPEIVDAFQAVVHLDERLVILLDLDRILPKAEYEIPVVESSEES